MEHIKSTLIQHGFDNSTIGKLDTLEPRDGFMVLNQEAFEEMQNYLNEFPVYQFLVPVLTDDNSNYWCVYVDGPLKNMVCYVGHDEPSLEPRFRNLSSLIDAINNYEDQFFDFPGREESQSRLQDREIIAELYKIVETETDDDQIRAQAAFSIMALTSPVDIEEIIYPFLNDEDIYMYRNEQ